MLAVAGLGSEAYGVAVQQLLEKEMRREVAMGAVYAALERMERKGFLTSTLGDVTAARGGRRKLISESCTFTFGVSSGASASIPPSSTTNPRTSSTTTSGVIVLFVTWKLELVRSVYSTTGGLTDCACATAGATSSAATATRWSA